MAQSLRETLLFYLSHLYPVDFLFAFLVIFIFISLLLFVAFLRHKPLIASFLIFFDFIFCALLCFYGYHFIDSKIRARSVAIISEKFFNSSNFALDVSLKNLSAYNFKYCKIKAKLYHQVDENASFISSYKERLLPFRIKSKTIEKSLNKGEQSEQRINFNNLSPENNFSIILKSECF